jgi:hypothetical protein
MGRKTLISKIRLAISLSIRVNVSISRKQVVGFRRKKLTHLNISIEQQGKQRGRERENGRDRVMERTNKMKD